MILTESYCVYTQDRSCGTCDVPIGAHSSAAPSTATFLTLTLWVFAGSNEEKEKAHAQVSIGALFEAIRQS